MRDDRNAKTPRAASSYRGARRNAAKAARMLPEWRTVIAHDANVKANLVGRQNQANAAREAAAKALVNNREMRPDIVAGVAMLEFYRGEKRTRSISRIIRDLEVQVRAVGRS